MTPRRFILIRREPAGGGAESFLHRLARSLDPYGSTEIWNAGDSANRSHSLAGSSGPSWWRAIAFARSVNRQVSSLPQNACVISFARGVGGDIFRLGDGIHREWVRIKYRSSLRQFANPLNQIYPRLERESIRTARRVVANSTLVLEQASNLYPDFSYKFSLIENGFDEIHHHFTPSPPGVAHGPRFLFAGHGWERKGLAAAIRIVAGIPSARLVVCGRGKPSRFQKVIADSKLKTRVEFHGEVPDIRPFLRQTHAFILPTLYDPFSNACLEALANGRPVITTAANGIASRLAPHTNGFVLSRDGGPEAVAAWWQRTAPTLDPTVIARSVSDLTSAEVTDRWLRLIEETLPIPR